eukprot:scaffold4070_cov308-Prasinococcus_capsulatus_cf.AAC.1
MRLLSLAELAARAGAADRRAGGGAVGGARHLRAAPRRQDGPAAPGTRGARRRSLPTLRSLTGLVALRALAPTGDVTGGGRDAQDLPQLRPRRVAAAAGAHLRLDQLPRGRVGPPGPRQGAGGRGLALLSVPSACAGSSLSVRVCNWTCGRALRALRRTRCSVHAAAAAAAAATRGAHRRTRRPFLFAGPTRAVVGLAATTTTTVTAGSACAPVARRRSPAGGPRADPRSAQPPPLGLATPTYGHAAQPRDLEQLLAQAPVAFGGALDVDGGHSHAALPEGPLRLDAVDVASGHEDHEVHLCVGGTALQHPLHAASARRRNSFPRRQRVVAVGRVLHRPRPAAVLRPTPSPAPLAAAPVRGAHLRPLHGPPNEAGHPAGADPPALGWPAAVMPCGQAAQRGRPHK